MVQNKNGVYKTTSNIEQKAAEALPELPFLDYYQINRVWIKIWT
jgi:hypothetical protein